MKDPILAGLGIAPGWFQLGHPFSPIGIRDQILRAALLSERLWERRTVAEGSQVLVVGAGAAGVTVASHLADFGANVTLVEANDRPFGLQHASKTRWLDPAQYDWPAGHWREKRYPWQNPRVRLEWSAGFADQVALLWENEFKSVREEIDCRWDCRITEQHYIENINGKFRFFLPPPLTVTSASLGDIKDFDVVIWATGFAVEKHFIDLEVAGKTVRKCVGTPFWGNDTLTKSACGLNTQRKRVLIFGSGDGALQDFLRAATAKDSAREICDELNLQPSVWAKAFTIETQAHCSLIWANDRAHDHHIYSVRHKAYKELVDELWRSDPTFKAKARGLVRRDIDALWISHVCDHFNGYYGLNCFLALVVSRAWQEKNDEGNHGAVILEGTLTEDIDRIYKTDKTGTPPGGTFTVKLASCPLCVDLNGQGSSKEVSAEILVPRLGIGKPEEGPVMWKNLAAVLPDRPRHLLPYHLTLKDERLEKRFGVPIT
jgi:hypothetical protein